MNKKLLFILFTSSIFLAIRYILFFLYQPKVTDGQMLSFETTVLDEPKTAFGSQKVNVFYNNFFGGELITLHYPSKMLLHYGDSITVSGRINKKLIGNKRVLTNL